jgi:carbon catabolite-derepressing protein kinase
MDLQLYRVDADNYLVDFRNVGYHHLSPSESGIPDISGNFNGNRGNGALGSEATGKSAGSANGGVPAGPSMAGSGSAGTGTGVAGGNKNNSIGGVSGPFHFLEMACQLIAELASG